MAQKFIFHTYGANPMACAAGRAVLQVIRKDDMIANAARVGAVLKSHMEDLMQRHPVIGNVRGKGFMMAMEMVKDRQTREPDPDSTARIFEETRNAGLIMSKSGTFKNVLRMTPPLCVQMDDVPQIVEALERAFAMAKARH
jgi:alanine-glyoxylate transaminase/(R)-3-amino-2-methylpropionate-pyruvate transaminase